MMEKTQDILAFAQDKINEIYHQAKHEKFDEQDVMAMVAVTKHLLDTAVKLEALDKLTHLKDWYNDANELNQVFCMILES